MSDATRTINTSHGRFTIDMVRDKKIGAGLERGVYHQEETLTLLKSFITKDSTVLDIGAHVGTLTVPLARLARKVISFEPDPTTFALLKKNIEQNSLTVDARNKGLGALAGMAALHTGQDTNAGANTLVLGSGSVVVSTLDAEVEHADLIKIDVEGMELKVLEGGEKLIARSRPVIFFEVNLPALRSHQVHLAILGRFFSSRRYNFYVSEGGRLGKVSLLLAALVLAPRALLGGEAGPFDLLALPQEKSVSAPAEGFVGGAYLLWRHRRARKK